MADEVNHPAYYNVGGELDEDGSSKYETIKLIDDMGWGYQFCMGTALKYVMRGPHKENLRRDIEKACWYLRRALTYTEPRPTQVVLDAVHVERVIAAWQMTPDLGAAARYIYQDYPSGALHVLNNLLEATR